MASGDCVQSSSQIPGLSNVPLEEEDMKRKNYIRDSDSEYIKLAKQGGAKDLLAPQPMDKSDDVVEYKKSEWFGHHSMGEEDQKKILENSKWQAPDYMTHELAPQRATLADAMAPSSDKMHALSAREERMLIKAKYTNREVPFQSDNLSCWERKEEPTKRNRFHK